MISDIWEIVRSIVLIVLGILGFIITGIAHIAFFPFGLIFQLKPNFSFEIRKI